MSDNQEMSPDQPPLTRSQYLELVLKTTADMLGILQAEVQMGMQSGKMQEWDVIHFRVAMKVLEDLQLLAKQAKMASESPDLIVVEQDRTLVDKNGNPFPA